MALVENPEPRGGTVETNDLVSAPRYGGSMSSDVRMRRADARQAPGALPASYYRRISFPAWGAVLALGTVSWVALFHLL